MSKLHILTLSALAWTGALGAEAAAAEFFGLGDLPGMGFHSSATAVSADGSTVVGSLYAPVTGDSGGAFRWTRDEGMVGLGQAPGLGITVVRDLSADGSVVVGEARTEDGIPKAVRWTHEDGVVRIEDSDGYEYIRAYGVSADGSVVVGVADFPYPIGPYRAFQWTQQGGMVPLGALPGEWDGGWVSRSYATSADGSVVVGSGRIDLAGDYTEQAFRWTETSGFVPLMGMPPNDRYGLSWALDVSPDGSIVVGTGQVSAGSVNAWMWTEANGVVDLGNLPDPYIYSVPLHRLTAASVSADGTRVVGHLSTGSGTQAGQRWRAYIWDPIDGMRTLQDVLIQEYALGPSLEGWLLFEATDISDDGRVIVGEGLNPAGDREAWMAVIPAVPEPAGWLLIGLGLWMLGAWSGANQPRSQVGSLCRRPL